KTEPLRGATLESALVRGINHSSVAPRRQAIYRPLRGLKPTATLTSSLRDEIKMPAPPATPFSNCLSRRFGSIVRAWPTLLHPAPGSSRSDGAAERHLTVAVGFSPRTGADAEPRRVATLEIAHHPTPNRSCVATRRPPALRLTVG